MSPTRAISQGKAKLKPRARLISLIGEDLISDEPVALVELVKNAYDADASTVEVKFVGSQSDIPEQIIVTDNGIGMDIDTVLNIWLEPGTPNKRRKNKSPSGRLLQGEKGIGRFAAARLARKLLLQTKSVESDNEVLVVLDWGSFDEDSYLEDIEIEYEIGETNGPAGTSLIMEEIRSPWMQKEYEALYDRLSRLISPFDEITDFEITLNIENYPDYSRKVESPDLIRDPRYILRGELDDEGYFSGEFIFEGITQKIWGIDWVNKYKQNQILDHLPIEPRLKRKAHNQIPVSGGFEFEIRAWDRDKEGLEPYALRYAESVSTIRSILNRYSGVSIYRDGFRVYPYGQSGNDWLKLDNRSRQAPTMRLANNQIIAAIKISRDRNPELKDRSNREGMVVNEAYVELEEWFKEILAVLEDERYKIRPRSKTIEQSSSSLFEPFDLSATLALAKQSLGADHSFVSVLANVASEVDKGIEHVQEIFSRLLMTAGLGQMIDMVIHDIGHPLGKLDRQLRLLQKAIQKECAEITSHLPYVEGIKASIQEIHNFRERLDPHTPAKRGRSQLFELREEIQNNFDLFEYILNKQGITYRIDLAAQSIMIKMVRSSLGQILANLIDNSIFWLIRDKGVGNGGAIQVEVFETDDAYHIIFSDDGPGVAPGDRLNIFEPYYSKKPNGSGLGLYIARLLIEPHGRITYIEDCSLPGACFEIYLKKEKVS